jgi:hypothetical protein
MTDKSDDVTEFTDKDARRFAANAFRFRADKFSSADEQIKLGQAHRPLVGKEKELLKALMSARRRYIACKDEIKTIRQLRKSDAELSEQCAAIAERLQQITDTLSGLDEISREELNLIALGQGSSFEEMCERLEDLLCWATEGADEEFFPPIQKTAGSKLGIGKGGVPRVPFEEFAKELRNFLLRPDIGMEFSFEDARRDNRDRTIHEPVSAAARLLYDATRTLDDRVKVTDVGAVMRAAKRKPEFRNELLGDPAVDALTR